MLALVWSPNSRFLGSLLYVCRHEKIMVSKKSGPEFTDFCNENAMVRVLLNADNELDVRFCE